MTTRAEPLSIESLLQKQREEKEAAAKASLVFSSMHPVTNAQLLSPSSLQRSSALNLLSRSVHKRSRNSERGKNAPSETVRPLSGKRKKSEQGKGSESVLRATAAEVAVRCFTMAAFLLLTLTCTDDDRYDRDRDRDRGDRYGRRGDRDRRPPPPDDRRGGGRESGGSSYQGVPTGPRADRGKAPPTGPASSSSSMPPPPPPSGASNGHGSSALLEASQSYDPPMTNNDLDAIRSRYLGVDKKKRRIRKMNDRKFVFDWDEQDDTYNAETPAAIGSQRQGAQIGFGRGHIAGMDDAGGAIVPGRKDAGEGMVLADPLERRKAARAGLDERHWSEKSLDEMKERDWRIFREDFSIAARGRCLPTSLQNDCGTDAQGYRWTNSAPPTVLEGICHSRRDPRHC